MRGVSSHGFTVVELLVAIATLVILVSMFLTSRSGARQKAHQAQCAANVNRLGQALQQFVGERNEYPRTANTSVYSSGSPMDYTSWIDALEQRRTKDASGASRPTLDSAVWNCPGARRPSGIRSDAEYSSYGFNAYGLGSSHSGFALGLGGQIHTADTNSVTLRATKASDVLRPANMMAIGDGFVGGNGVIVDGVWILRRLANVEDRQSSTARSNSRHRGNATIAFCDGHVESLSLKTLFESTDPEDLKRWNADGQPHNDLSPP